MSSPSRPGRPVVVLRAGDAPAPIALRRGEFFEWIRHTAGDAWPGEWLEHDLRAAASPPAPMTVSAVVVTGSAASVTERAEWMLRAESYLRDVASARVPLFGICFGHQLLAQALGGRVERNPRGREIGTVTLRATRSAAKDPIFGGAHEGLVNMTHTDTVVELPPRAEVLARTVHDEVAAFRVDEAWGVQFHPEIDGEVMRGYVQVRGQFIRDEGLPYEEILERAADAPAGAESLRAFLRYVART
jgi:GMP synthase (glutamine-hydrolysing)